MTKPQALDLLMLLSALESWALADGKRLPDYLADRLDAAIGILRGEVLGTQSGSNSPGQEGE